MISYYFVKYKTEAGYHTTVYRMWFFESLITRMRDTLDRIDCLYIESIKKL